MIRFFSFCALFLCASLTIVFSQNSTVEDYLTHFPEAKVAFDEYHTTYDFFWDESTQELRVRETDEVKLVAIKPVSSFVWPIFYNDQITVGDFDVKTQLGKKVKYLKYCGHHGQSGIFHSDARLCTFEFTISDVGDRTNLKVDQTYLDPRYFTKIPLQSFIPGKTRIVDIYWPDWVEVEMRDFHFEQASIEKSDIAGNGKMGVRYQINWPNEIPDEEENPHFSHYIPHVIPITKAYTAPSSERTVLLETTDNLYGWYRELIRDVKNEPDSLTNLVQTITDGLSQEEQIRAIYYWVQDNIQYIAFENGIMGFQPDNAHDVLYKRYGDCKGMANLLKEMLILAGFDARLTWLGTNMLPYTYDIPSLTVDNHMICTVLRDGQVLILDATVKFNQLGYSPYHIQGKQMMIEDGPSYQIHTIPFVSFDHNFESFQLDATIEGDLLVGKGQLTFDGDAKQFFLYALNTIEKKDHHKFMRYIIAQDADPDDFEIDLIKADRESLVEIAVNNQLKNKVNKYGEELFVELDFRREFAHMKIKKNRKSPYDFGRRRYVKSEVRVQIPDGYVLKHAPESIAFEGEEFQFKLNYEVQGQKVVYTKELTIDTAILKQASFGKWNDAIDQMTKFYKEPLIFLKNAE